jgi:transcriptional regulator with XRE-family HTH domain
MEDIMSQDTTGDHGTAQEPSSNSPDSVFARRLRAVRKQAGATQQELADRMAAAGHKMHRSAIAKIESGERPVAIGEAVQLAGVLGASLTDLVTDDMTGRQQREYRQLAEAKIKVRSLEHETAERDKLLQEAQFLYENAVDRLQAARAELHKLELRMKVREQQAKFGKTAWFEGDPDAPDAVKAAWAQEENQ